MIPAICEADDGHAQSQISSTVLAGIFAASCVAAAVGEQPGTGIPSPLAGGPVLVHVDCGKVVNTMRGGIGASWHAMQTTLMRRRAAAAGAATRRPRTTGHGGRFTATPVGSGFDWNRVEVEQRIYEPERNKFTFDSPEMRILYRILDWHQTQRRGRVLPADVVQRRVAGLPGVPRRPGRAGPQRAGGPGRLRGRPGDPDGALDRPSRVHVHQVAVHHQRAGRLVAGPAQQGALDRTGAGRGPQGARQAGV